MKIYMFTAPWCEPCSVYKPVVLSALLDVADVEVVDVTQQPDLASTFQVMTVPALRKVRPDGTVGVLDGVRTKTQIIKWLKEG